ncbi:MAG: hypothetical protein HY760_08635 [Nitrospirae bacterium]|nr:hypothetical protein [Nitrospirota bacterium]
MRNAFHPKKLVHFLLLLGGLLLSPGITFADGEDFGREVDIERDEIEGDMDRDSTHYEEVRHEEFPRDLDEDREVDIERDEIEGDMDRDGIHYEEIEHDLKEDREDLHERDRDEEIRDQKDEEEIEDPLDSHKDRLD